MSLKDVATNAGISPELAENLVSAGINTSAVVALSASGTYEAFETTIASALKDMPETPAWQTRALFGFIQLRLTEIRAITEIHDNEKKQETKQNEVKKEETKSGRVEKMEDAMFELIALQAELGMQSLSVPHMILKGLLTDVGTDAIDMPGKVAKVVLNARKGKVSEQDMAMHVSGSGEVVPKMAAGMGARKEVWSLARKNWTKFMIFLRKVRKILSRVTSGDEGEEAVMSWEAFIEYLEDLAEVRTERVAAEYFCTFSKEYDFSWQDDGGKSRPAKDDKIKLLTAKAMRSAKVVEVDSDDDDFRQPRGGKKDRDKKDSQQNKKKKGCLKCGKTDHTVFACPDRLKDPLCCIICGIPRDDCTSMWECSERHADSK